MADPYFQRQVLLQLFLIVDYLLQATVKIRERITKLPTLNKSILPPKDVSPEQEAWAKEAKAKIQRELMNTPPNGRRFIETISVVMKSERRWAEWKAKNCPVWERPPLDLSKKMEDLRSKHKRMTTLRRGFRYPVGTMALSRLWSNDFADDSYLLSSTRFRTPTFEEYVENQNIVDEDGLLRAPYPPRAARDVNFGTTNAFRQWKVVMCKKAERKKVMEMEVAARAAALKMAETMAAQKEGAETIKQGESSNSADAVKQKEEGKEVMVKVELADTGSMEVEGAKEKDPEPDIKKEEPAEEDNVIDQTKVSENATSISDREGDKEQVAEQFKEETVDQVEAPKEVLGKRKECDTSEDAADENETDANGTPPKKLKSTDDASDEVANNKVTDADASTSKEVNPNLASGYASEEKAAEPSRSSPKRTHAIEENETDANPSTPKKAKLAHSTEESETDAHSSTSTEAKPTRESSDEDKSKPPPPTEAPKETNEAVEKRGEYEIRLAEIQRMEADFKETAPNTVKRKLMNENVEISVEEQEAYDLRMWRGIRLASRHHLTLGRSGRVEDFGLILMEAQRNRST